MFTFQSTLPVWEWRIPWKLSKQISKLFFQISAQVYSVPRETEGRKKALFEWKGIGLSYELFLTCGGNVNYFKSILFLAKNEGEKKPF